MGLTEAEVIKEYIQRSKISLIPRPSLHAHTTKNTLQKVECIFFGACGEGLGTRLEQDFNSFILQTTNNCLGFFYTLYESHPCVSELGAAEGEFGEGMHRCEAGDAHISDVAIVHQVQ